MSDAAKVHSTRPQIIQLASGTDEYQPLFNESNTHQYHSGCVTLKPGESVGEHSTKSHEEIIIFLEGSGEVSSEHWERPQAVTAPAVAYMTPHTLHNVTNMGTSRLRYVYVVAKV